MTKAEEKEVEVEKGEEQVRCSGSSIGLNESDKHEIRKYKKMNSFKTFLFTKNQNTRLFTCSHSVPTIHFNFDCLNNVIPSFSPFYSRVSCPLTGGLILIIFNIELGTN